MNTDKGTDEIKNQESDEKYDEPRRTQRPERRRRGEKRREILHPLSRVQDDV
jgi:hypothetical protein